MQIRLYALAVLLTAFGANSADLNKFTLPPAMRPLTSQEVWSPVEVDGVIEDEWSVPDMMTIEHSGTRFHVWQLGVLGQGDCYGEPNAACFPQAVKNNAALLLAARTRDQIPQLLKPLTCVEHAHYQLATITEQIVAINPHSIDVLGKRLYNEREVHGVKLVEDIYLETVLAMYDSPYAGKLPWRDQFIVSKLFLSEGLDQDVLDAQRPFNLSSNVQALLRLWNAHKAHRFGVVVQVDDPVDHYVGVVLNRRRGYVDVLITDSLHCNRVIEDQLETLVKPLISFIMQGGQ